MPTMTPHTSSDDAVSARELNVARGGQQILSEIEFAAREASLTAIVGPNGAGKTTLLKALAGLIPFSGSISYGGRALGSMSLQERATRVTYVPQRSALNAALSIEQVVAQGRYSHRLGWFASSRNDAVAIDRALAALDLEAIRNRPFTELSGGEQRRVLLARALATEARVILLDEPTASLDIAHSLTLFEKLEELTRAGRTVIAVLHQLDDAERVADQVLMLNRGRRVASGAPRDVLTPERVRAVYGVEVIEGGALGFRLSG